MGYHHAGHDSDFTSGFIDALSEPGVAVDGLDAGEIMFCRRTGYLSLHFTANHVPVTPGALFLDVHTLAALERIIDYYSFCDCVFSGVAICCRMGVWRLGDCRVGCFADGTGENV